jgi:two-component system, OmpR family, heavy metal sensor histidine kinase CusS
MTSIRRTVLLNVVCLLVITLGVVTAIVYSTSVEAIRAKRTAAESLVESRYQDNRDDELRKRADKLAGDVQSDFNRTGFRNHWVASQLSALGTPTAPSGQAPLLVSLATSLPGPACLDLNTRLVTELKLNEEEIYRQDQAMANAEFIQISGEWGAPWTSKSLGSHTLPLHESDIERDPEGGVHFDSLTLPNGTAVRRVIVKAPITRFSRTGNFWLPRPQRPDEPPPSRAVIGLASAARAVPREPREPRGPGGPGGPPAPKFDPRTNVLGVSLPFIYVQCAWAEDQAIPRLAELEARRAAELTNIEAETEASIGQVRTTLAWTAAAAVAATLLGGWFLVGLGLSPLRRLSDAVSQISAKDFRLPLDHRKLPSEINPVADRLSVALADLQAAFEREKRAAADISHELRTPLAALTTTIEVARRKPRSDEQYRQTLDDCKAIARQMSQLVERMLALAWIDAGADEVRPERVDVPDLVGGVAAIARPLAEVQGLSFKVSVPADLIVRTDPAKLREVVMNLTHNAIEYNRPGGEVELRAAKSADGVTVEVSDTGIGMSPEVQEKIFERFFRADPSRSATGVHAGLGLAIVKEYVDRLGGRLTVESAPGRGSRFRIELPNAL